MFERRRSAGKIVQLPVEDIHPSPYQARTTFDEQELAGLAQSIRENGPLIGMAIYFHLTKGRAQKTEEQAMDNLWLELPWWFI